MTVYEIFLAWLVVFFTLAIFSFLYKDNPFYRLAEHVFVGLSVGYSIVVSFANVIQPDLITPLYNFAQHYTGKTVPGTAPSNNLGNVAGSTMVLNLPSLAEINAASGADMVDIEGISLPLKMEKGLAQLEVDIPNALVAAPTEERIIEETDVWILIPLGDSRIAKLELLDAKVSVAVSEASSPYRLPVTVGDVDVSLNVAGAAAITISDATISIAEGGTEIGRHLIGQVTDYSTYEVSPLWRVIGLILIIMMCMRLTKTKRWMSRWPLAFLVGTYSGVRLVGECQALLVEQSIRTIMPLWPVQGNELHELAQQGQVWVSWEGPSVFNNWLIVVGVMCCLIHFFFSVEHKGVLKGASNFAVLVLMVTFGAHFGYTVLARVSLLIGRVRDLQERATGEFYYASWVIGIAMMTYFIGEKIIQTTRKQEQ
jgi:hypothetical protein